MAEIIIIDPNGGPSSTVRCALNNTARGTDSTVSGGNNNSATANGSTVSGGFTNTAANCCSTIAGGSLNLAGAEYSFIGSGRLNTTDDSYSIVVGGENNFAGCECSFVGGGQFNSSTYQFSNVVGGLCNLAGADHGSILGGFNNSVIGACSSILGGDNNTAFSDSTVIGGGACNQSYSTYGSIGGGSGNKIYLDGATVVGGQNNTAIQYNSTVVGGYNNYVNGSCSLAGGNSNTVCGNNSFVFSNNSTLNANNSVILGGSNIVGNTTNTVFVPNLNISTLGTGSTINNLGIDSDGFVVIGTTSSGSTPTLSQVVLAGNQTGCDIIMSNGSSILNELQTGFIRVNDSGLGNSVDMTATQVGSLLYTEYGQKFNGVGFTSFDSSLSTQVNLSLRDGKSGQILSPLAEEVDNYQDSFIFMNGFKMSRASILTTGSTPEIVYVLSGTGIPNFVTQLKVYSSGYDLTGTSGITQELVSSYVTNGTSIVEIGSGASIPYTASNFPPSVTTTLTNSSSEIVVRVIGLASTNIDWSIKIVAT